MMVPTDQLRLQPSFFKPFAHQSAFLLRATVPLPFNNWSSEDAGLGDIALTPWYVPDIRGGSGAELEKNWMSNQDTPPKGNAAMQGRHASDIVEFIAALLMALATIASAWCGYQSTRWNGKQSILAGETAALRFEATRKLTLAGQEAVIDISTFEQLHRALIEDRTEYVQRILKRFRPEARVAVDAWLATDPFKNPSAPSGPFRMKEYRPRLAEEANALDQEADRKFSQAREANKHVDRYTMLTIMLTSVLFFAGLATHFTSAPMQGGVLLLGLLLFLGTLIVLIGLPVA